MLEKTPGITRIIDRNSSDTRKTSGITRSIDRNSSDTRKNFWYHYK